MGTVGGHRGSIDLEVEGGSYQNAKIRFLLHLLHIALCHFIMIFGQNAPPCAHVWSGEKVVLCTLDWLSPLVRRPGSYSCVCLPPMEMGVRLPKEKDASLIVQRHVRISIGRFCMFGTWMGTFVWLVPPVELEIKPAATLFQMA